MRLSAARASKSTWFGGIILGAVGLVGCAVPPTAADSPAKDKPADPDYNRAQTVRALRVVLEQRLTSPGVEGFARLTAARQAALQTLRTQGQRIELLATADRLVISLPSSFPGGARELLIADDQDALYGFGGGMSRQPHSRDRLADLLDAASLPVLCDELSLVPADDSQAKSPATAQPRRARLRKLSSATVELALRCRPPGRRATRWPLRLRIQLTHPDGTRAFGAVAPLVQMALPLLSGAPGNELVEHLAATLPQLAAWEIEVHNEAHPALVAPRLVSDVVQIEHARVPLRRFSTRRDAPRDKLVAGVQVASPALLRELRPGLPRGTGPSRGVHTPDDLLLVNHSRFAVAVYVDGALLGWVGAQREFRFSGLPAGYYRLYAHTPTGTQAWGPVDRYVPASWTLR